MLSPEQVERLESELRLSVYDGLTADAGFSLLNDSQPVTVVTQVAKPMTVAAIMGSLSPASMARMVVNPNLSDMRDKILGQDFVGVDLWGQLLVGGGQIELSEYQAIAAELAATVEVRTTTISPPRIATAFSGKNPEDPSQPLVSMPNQIDRDDFDAAWIAAGRI